MVVTFVDLWIWSIFCCFDTNYDALYASIEYTHTIHVPKSCFSNMVLVGD
jgi:hypothetical protein